jgi:hypothetical protein
VILNCGGSALIATSCISLSRFRLEAFDQSGNYYVRHSLKYVIKHWSMGMKTKMHLIKHRDGSREICDKLQGNNTHNPLDRRLSELSWT